MIIFVIGLILSSTAIGFIFGKIITLRIAVWAQEDIFKQLSKKAQEEYKNVVNSLHKAKGSGN